MDAAGGKQMAKEAIEGLFAYCGRPLDSEFKHEEHGFKQYLSGRRKEMRKFYYASATNQYSKGVCFFAVEVVPAAGSGHRVTTFGPLKLQSGQLPDWLKKGADRCGADCSGISCVETVKVKTGPCFAWGGGGQVIPEWGTAGIPEAAGAFTGVNFLLRQGLRFFPRPCRFRS